MLFYYIRHGDPIYNPDSLTPLGERQAEALAKRLAVYGLDKIYASTSNRAQQTAQPTCELLKKEMTLLDFASEMYAYNELSIIKENGRKCFLFEHPETKLLFTEDSIRTLGFEWYKHPAFKEYDFGYGINRIYDEMDKFFLSLGYEHIRYTGKYKPVAPTDERVALFAHAGFGIAALSCLLDIPYPEFCLRFDLSHSGMTVIKFHEESGVVIPKVLTWSSDSHLYREGLPTRYNNTIEF